MAQAAHLRVLTLNHYSRHADWPARREVLASGLRALNPDIIAFIETVVTENVDTVAEILGDGYHVAHQQDRAPDGTGISIASRWPLLDLREHDLHVTPRSASLFCSLLTAEIETPVGRLLFANHLPSYELDFELERELQTVSATRFIEYVVGDREMHVILAGDLDATPDAASIRFLRGLQSLDGMSVAYRDAWERAHPGDPGYTFDSRNPLRTPEWDIDRRIDYLFVRCTHEGPTLDVARCELAFAEPVDGVWASDHFGVVADFAPRALTG